MEMSPKLDSRPSSLAIILGLCMIAIASPIPARAADANSSEVANTQAAATSNVDDVEALVAEAMRQSPLIAAARNHWRAQEKIPIQESTLPDPELMLQPFTLCSPQPVPDHSTTHFYLPAF